ncbi:MAG: 6-bladed beta-propeller [Flavisolibacter sp.]|nr:6-bladed beta-propeller [Flavisolibacter sp.]
MRITLVHFALLVSCLLNSTIARTQLQKIYLHPKAAGNAKQSQFVDSVRVIPLQIVDGVAIGTYNNVVVTEKYFLIVDYPNKAILLYSKKGRFVKRISYKKLGEAFYPDYDEHTEQLVFLGNNKNYKLTPKDELKITLDWNNPRNRKYFKKYTVDLKDTSFVMKKAIVNEKDVLHTYHFYDDFYWQGRITTSPLFKDSLDYEFKIYKNSQLVNGYFPYNRVNEPRFLYTNQSTSFSKTDTPYIRFITRPYCDTIYKMKRDSLFPAYQLVLPLENSLPPDFFTNPFKNKTERENFERNNAWMFSQVYNFYETPQFIFFRVRYLYNSDFYIYQKQTNVTYKTKNIKPDTSQYNLQLLSDYGTLRKGDRFYKSQKAGDLLTFFAQHKDVPVPIELESFLKSNPPATTPVIVEFKLKN